MRPNLAVLRSAIGPILTETGTITREDGYWTDPDTGMEEPRMVTIHDGPCLVRPEGVQYVVVGGVERPIQRYDVTLPAETPAEIGDVLVLGDVPHEPDLSGAQIRITDAPLDSWAVARFCKGERAT